jgi:hypothetical protein
MSATYEALKNTLDLAKNAQALPGLENTEFGVKIIYRKMNEKNIMASVLASFKARKINYYHFDNVEQVTKYFERLVTRAKRVLERGAERRAGMKADKEKFLAQLRPGVILTASWGYEQTNVEFFEVLEVKGSKVKIQELGHVTVEGSEKSWASCDVMPDLECKIGEVLEKTVASAGIKINSSVTLRLWNGKSCYKSWYY